MMRKQEALVDQLIQTERAVSDFLGDPPTSPATISIWSPLQPHLSRLHQVAFLHISQSSTHGSYHSVGILLNGSSVTGLSRYDSD